MPTQIKNRFAPIRILSIESYGFSYLPRQEIVLHESITAAIGENGSGKTTFLNLLRVLLGAVRFDNEQSLKTFFERDDIYDIYILGKFDNTLQKQYGKQPFDTIGKYNDVVSVVCRLQKDQLDVKTTYLIYDGMFDLDKNLKNSHRWLEPKQFRKQMEDVGLSKALINSFSLNQGNTEEVLKKSEEELAEYLLDICGEQERILNFQAIKSDVKRQKEQYSYLLKQKEIDEAQVQRLQERIERSKKIIENEECLTKLKFDLPIADFIYKRKELINYKNSIMELEDTLAQILAQIKAFQEENRISENEYNRLESRNKIITIKNRNFQGKQYKIYEILCELKTKIAALEEFLIRYRGINPVPEDLLENERLAKEENYSNALGELKVIEKDKLALENRIAYLERNGTIVYPPDVQNMLKILHKKGIEHLLIADYIEILDEEWREGIEALFGQERFTIVVSHENIIDVMKWARDIKYPYWISPYKSIELKVNENSVLKKINILDARISGYLEKFQDYYISDTMEDAWKWVKRGKNSILNKPHPYKVISRGGRYIKSNGKYCGKLAYKVQLEESKKELSRLIPIYNSILEKVRFAKKVLNEILEKIEEQKNVRTVPKKEQELNAINERKNKALNIYNKILAALEENELKSEELVKRIKELYSRCNVINVSLSQETDKRKSLLKEIEKQKNLQEKLQNNLSTIEGNLPESQKKLLDNTEYISNLKEVDYYSREIGILIAVIDQLRNISISEKIEPGEEKRIVNLEQKYRHHQNMLKQYIEEIERVSSELEQLEQKHRIVQEEYHLMVEEVFFKVKHSLETLCTIGNIQADFKAFYIGEDRWKVDYRIGFHGKKPQSYRIKTGFSGGQKVIASLLLTLAAIKSDGALSFMILDEPFAHLDHERINQAGEFLRSTGVQFVIAMPYSENVKLLMPWVDMILNCRPKRMGEVVAPPVTYGVINNEYLAQRNFI